MFSKKVEPRCVYCKRGIALNDDQMVCPKKGIVTAGDSCRAFRYDPLKRVPPKLLSIWERKVKLTSACSKHT